MTPIPVIVWLITYLMAQLVKMVTAALKTTFAKMDNVLAARLLPARKKPAIQQAFASRKAENVFISRSLMVHLVTITIPVLLANRAKLGSV